MTEAQAHAFLLKCKRRLLWRTDISDSEAIIKAKRGCWVYLIAILIRLILLVSHGIWNETGFDYYSDICLLFFGLILITVLTWILICVNQAQNALNQSDVTKREKV